MNTIDIVEKIILNYKIKYLTFYKYPKQVLLQDILEKSDDTDTIITEAKEIRKKYRFPFWDSLMVSTFNKKDVSKKLLNRALWHNKNKEEISTKNIEYIKNLINSNNYTNLSFNSKVILDDSSVYHFFMIDFHIYISNENLNTVYSVLELLELHGYVLDSGESYHFISDSLIDIDTLITLLGKSLLFSPIIDRAWIAHQIIERSCSLRLGKKHGKYPTVIAKV